MDFSNWAEFISRKCLIALLFLLSGYFSLSIGQTLDTSIDVIGIGSSSDRTPFWIESNRFGRFSSNGSQFLTRFQAYGSTDEDQFGPIKVFYGADLIARPGPQSTVNFNQGYLKISAYAFEFSGGRFHGRSPLHDERLSMGSLGVSGNAVPVPQVRFGIPEWTGIPFTQNFVRIRAHLAHGWLEKDRYTKSPFYQEKVGHLRFGGKFPLNVYGGLAHYAMWGGDDNPQFGDLPDELSDFFRVFIGVGGDERAPDVEADYLLGDHLGAWDFGLFLELDSVYMKIYRQLPLETKDNLKLKSLQDALNGISIRFNESLNFPVKGLTYEFMYTKWQDGPRVENVLPDGTRCFDFPERCRDPYQGNENYYNHHIYRVGWANRGRTIGNPLFQTSEVPTDQLGEGIINNRIVAHHIGVETEVMNTEVIGKFTFSRNYGTRKNPFDSPINQFSAGILTRRNITLFDQPLILLADFALDSGDLFGSQFGASVGLRWSL
ncbi:capsule assembly Wzi family protein [Rhodohalobacter sp. 8-1]|uniref:capsule assembly Wzi family protein n=1 Tax=Rhodohalobacter sp. 8-1 TaxID=3131972 RepID=UPI0030EF8F51